MRSAATSRASGDGAAGADCRGWEDAARVFAPFRDAVAELVGFRCPRNTHPVLGSVAAYEVAYQRLYDAVVGLLPPSQLLRTRLCLNALLA